MSVGVEMGACTDLAACARECDAGSSDRCRRMGVSYEFSKGVDADLVHATELYEKACAMGDSEGCISAGRMNGVSSWRCRTMRTAVGFYERALDLQQPAGCADLAILLESRVGRTSRGDTPLARRAALRPGVREWVRASHVSAARHCVPCRTQQPRG